MAKVLAILLFWTGLACASTGNRLVQDTRKLTGDVGTSVTPFTWPDSSVLAQLNKGISEVGVLGLAVTVWDTITLSMDVLSYTLARDPVELQTGYRLDESAGMFGISMVNVSDFWNVVSGQMAFCLVDNTIFVTQKLSESYKVVLVYTSVPAKLDSLGASTDIPDAIEPAVTYLASANLMMATRTQSNMAIGQAYRQIGTQMIVRWMQARRGKPTDSLAIPN